MPLQSRFLLTASARMRRTEKHKPPFRDLLNMRGKNKMVLVILWEEEKGETLGEVSAE
jgi:hypothetical protein